MSDKAAQLAAITDRVNKTALKKNPHRTEPVVFVAAGNEQYLSWGVLPTGNPAIDSAIGGGFPRGTIDMLAGPPGSGKTFAAFDMIAYNQRQDPAFYAMYVHLEARAFPTEVAEQAGVDMNRLLVLNAQQSGEATFDLVMEYLFDFDTMVSKDLLDLVVIDSIAAASSDREIRGIKEDGFAKEDMGTHAKMLSKLQRVISGCGSLGRSVLLLVNQVREDMNGVQGRKSLVLPGGRSPMHYAKIIVQVKKAEPIKEGDEQVGHVVKITVEKNNTGRGKPRAQREYRVIYGVGVDKVGPTIDQALELGIIEQLSSVMYRVTRGGVETKIKGRKEIRAAFDADPTLLEWAQAEIAGRAGPIPTGEPAAAD
jgi:recombination protein RecA